MAFLVVTVTGEVMDGYPFLASFARLIGPAQMTLDLWPFGVLSPYRRHIMCVCVCVAWPPQEQRSRRVIVVDC